MQSLFGALILKKWGRDQTSACIDALEPSMILNQCQDDESVLAAGYELVFSISVAMPSVLPAFNSHRWTRRWLRAPSVVPE